MSKPKIILVSEPVALKLTSTAINESVSQKEGRMIFPSILQRADAKNENTRIYPRNTLQREISKYIAENISERRAYGELDHSNESVVNFKNTCIHINKIWWDGDDVWGEIEVLDTPSGKIVQEVLKKGFSAGISSRGVGSVTELDENTVEVEDDFNLICWDIVTNPSTHGAFLKNGEKSMNENKEIQIDADPIGEVLSDILCMNVGWCSCELKK